MTEAAFSTKEIREIIGLPNIELYMLKSEVEASMTDEAVEAMNKNRAVSRRTELLLKNFKALEHEEHLQEVLSNGTKKLVLRFKMSP